MVGKSTNGKKDWTSDCRHPLKQRKKRGNWGGKDLIARKKGKTLRASPHKSNGVASTKKDEKQEEEPLSRFGRLASENGQGEKKTEESAAERKSLKKRILKRVKKACEKGETRQSPIL